MTKVIEEIGNTEIEGEKIETEEGEKEVRKGEKGEDLKIETEKVNSEPNQEDRKLITRVVNREKG